MEVKLEYEYKKYIEFNAEHITYLLGSNHEIKWKLYRGLKRFSSGKSLSDLEENVYGDDGIVIICNERQVKAKDVSLLFLDCRESLLENCRMKKDTLMYRYINEAESNFTIQRQLEKLNNELLSTETIFQEYMRQSLTHIVPTLKSATYTDIVKNFLELGFYENDTAYPLEMMDINQLIGDYCELLAVQINETKKATWLWINNPNAFMGRETFQKLLEQLVTISKETQLLNVFILSEDYLDLDFNKRNISETVLLFEDYQQLPEFSVLKESFSRYYPCELVKEDKELVASLFRIFPFVGSNKNPYLKEKDMVLLKVLEELLGINTQIRQCQKTEILNDLERKFLNN